jgi:hypothetical protein
MHINIPVKIYFTVSATRKYWLYSNIPFPSVNSHIVWQITSTGCSRSQNGCQLHYHAAVSVPTCVWTIMSQQIWNTMFIVYVILAIVIKIETFTPGKRRIDIHISRCHTICNGTAAWCVQGRVIPAVYSRLATSFRSLVIILTYLPLYYSTIWTSTFATVSTDIPSYEAIHGRMPLHYLFRSALCLQMVQVAFHGNVVPIVVEVHLFLCASSVWVDLLQCALDTEGSGPFDFREPLLAIIQLQPSACCARETLLPSSSLPRLWCGVS